MATPFSARTGTSSGPSRLITSWAPTMPTPAGKASNINSSSPDTLTNPPSTSRVQAIPRTLSPRRISSWNPASAISSMSAPSAVPAIMTPALHIASLTTKLKPCTGAASPTTSTLTARLTNRLGATLPPALSFRATLVREPPLSASGWTSPHPTPPPNLQRMSWMSYPSAHSNALPAAGS